MDANKVDLARTLLRNVYDPELGMNIIDLGLVYDISVSDDDKCRVLMTFTTLGCPVGPMIVDGVQEALGPLFEDVKVDLTFDPPWTPERMSDEAKRRMGWMR